MLTVKDLEELNDNPEFEELFARCSTTAAKLEQAGSYVSANNISDLIMLAQTLINTFGIPEPVYPAYHVNEYTGSEDDSKILTSQDILDSYFDNWIKIMIKSNNPGARELLIKRLGDACINDFVVSNLATGITEQ